eukprot:CAMPEP_0119372974 /NCGR_PEP_ID=MMETSP1334-20130426/23557_1 /TAXON_ID=127549 /ORGANISM="Calcidiscus leptoporus, Strain RCC1130" /LENGTH=121 /DNA_ID=CAMNT_0007390613 /DNA_START=44 /DNA_END=410 /DNA_ORIENTATION=+
MVFSFLAGPPNTIKEQQAAFQAAKKLSGNTHTAGGMAWNIGVFAIIAGGGLLLNLKGLPSLYYGTGKYVVSNDDDTPSAVGVMLSSLSAVLSFVVDPSFLVQPDEPRFLVSRMTTLLGFLI